LKLGASNTVIGLLAAIPALAQLVQIPSIYLVENYNEDPLLTELKIVIPFKTKFRRD